MCQRFSTQIRLLSQHLGFVVSGLGNDKTLEFDNLHRLASLFVSSPSL